MSGGLSFNRVILCEEGKPVSNLTVSEYLGIKVHRRVQLLLTGAVNFKLDDAEVPRNQALAELRSFEAANAA